MTLPASSLVLCCRTLQERLNTQMGSWGLFRHARPASATQAAQRGEFPCQLCRHRWARRISVAFQHDCWDDEAPKLVFLAHCFGNKAFARDSCQLKLQRWLRHPFGDVLVTTTAVPSE